MRHQKGTEFLQGGLFPAECDFAGRRLDSVYMDSESDFGSGLRLWQAGLGETPFWSKTEGWVIAVLCIITTWKTFGYNFINILAGVSGVSMEVIEAARLENVPMWKIFKDIVVPMSSATGIYVFITTIVQGLQYVFTPIKVVTQGGPNYASSNLIYMSYHEAFTLYKTGTSIGGIGHDDGTLYHSFGAGIPVCRKGGLL